MTAVRNQDSRARVYLFGSRTDDAKKGGDIDLLVLSATIGLPEKRRIRRAICEAIGEQKIDLIVAREVAAPLVRLAYESGVLLA